MMRHYLKLAFRNLGKCKNQTLVSVVGLAVGFVCFAMAAFWIRYEMSYDSFHKNAERIYCVGRRNVFSPISRRDDIPCFLAKYLKSTFPEIANAVVIIPTNMDLEYEGINHKNDFLWIDSSFFSMFDVKIIEGSMDFLIPESGKIAITREKALQLFGNESPVSKQIEFGEGYYEICAVVNSLPKRSNYPFDFLGGIRTTIQITMSGYIGCKGDLLIEVVSGIDIEAFEKKLNEHEFRQEELTIIGNENITLTPLISVHYKDPNIERDVRFQHIIIFVVAGSLLILCTLFNYLTLFVSRFRIRQRELTLRIVYGASGRSLFAMLSVEFIMSLIAALILGLILISILISSFLSVSGTRLDLPAIYFELIIYIAGVIVVAFTVFFFTLVIFRRHTLDANIRSNKKILRKISIVVQLIISIVFAFCTIIILKQMYYLRNSADLGFSFKNRGSVHIGISLDQVEILNDKIKQIPEIHETVTGYSPLLPIYTGYSVRIFDWDGKQGGDTENILNFIEISEQYGKFHEFELIEGEFLRDDDDGKYVLINESAAKIFGWNKAVGKSFGRSESNRCVVKGVVKNIYNFSPIIPAKPFYYHNQNSMFYMSISKQPYILFAHNKGSWKTCMAKINKIIEKEFPNNSYSYSNMEEEYDKYLKSENVLLAILTVVSLVCIIICIFGFVSIVSLTCEERRKEIAIRKINGATVKDILDIFFKEYLTLLAIGALIAFPVGYIIMKRWLQNYVIQTEMSAWVYVLILFALILVIVLCVGGRIYKTSRENPVNALNK